MRRTERLAALGQLSAGLAHEIRNPLSTIKGSAEMLLKNVDADSAVAHEMAGFISSEVDRTNALVTRFLDFARPLALRLEKTEITEVIDEAVAEVEKHTPPLDVSIYKNYSPDIPPFLLDRQLIERVLYNLLLNAAQASPPQGSVTVKTRQVGDTAEGDTVEIDVIDRGSGIAPKDRESIFNPFFTTKSSGVGLGLAIVSKIVDEHGGEITVESEPGAGSVFRRVPSYSGEWPMKATVLVVEDEEKLRRVVELQLKTAGYEVEQAGTAEDALKLADRADVIITDLRLPGLSGLEMLQNLRSQDLRTPVIVMTAFGSIETAVEAMKAGAVDFLPKPFSLDHLMTVVNKALEVRTLRDENRELRAELSQRYEFDNIIGRSAAMREIFATIERVAPTRATVLLCGESGVGKDMIARAIHHHSPRDEQARSSKSTAPRFPKI